jgi:hypothetical protein
MMILTNKHQSFIYPYIAAIVEYITDKLCIFDLSNSLGRRGFENEEVASGLGSRKPRRAKCLNWSTNGT